jgi:hypothetical protein
MAARGKYINPSQQALLAYKAYKKSLWGKKTTLDKAVKQFGVSKRMVQTAQLVALFAPSSLVRLVASGKERLNFVAEIIWEAEKNTGIDCKKGLNLL